MARPLRIEFAGALYHVMSRGNERKPMVRDDADREKRLDWLFEHQDNPSFPQHHKPLLRAYDLSEALVE